MRNVKLVLVVISTLMVFGCASEEQTAARRIPAGTKSTGGTGREGSVATSRYDWANALRVVRKHVVQIKAPNSHGTGFLVATSGNIVGVATALHVVRRADELQQPIRITHFDSHRSVVLESEQRLISKIEKMDSALICFRKEVLPLPDEPLSLPPQRNVRLMEGIEVGWCGYPAMLPNTLCFFSGRISAWIDDEESYLVDGVAIHGISGAPAFDITTMGVPVLVGLLTAYIPDRVTGESLPGVAVIRSINPYLSLFEKLGAPASGSSGDATNRSGP